jgi:hypothetical protein
MCESPALAAMAEREAWCCMGRPPAGHGRLEDGLPSLSVEAAVCPWCGAGAAELHAFLGSLTFRRLVSTRGGSRASIRMLGCEWLPARPFRLLAVRSCGRFRTRAATYADLLHPLHPDTAALERALADIDRHERWVDAAWPSAGGASVVPGDGDLLTLPFSSHAATPLVAEGEVSAMHLDVVLGHPVSSHLTNSTVAATYRRLRAHRLGELLVDRLR